jgi:hypothetical protein
VLSTGYAQRYPHDLWIKGALLHRAVRRPQMTGGSQPLCKNLWKTFALPCSHGAG